MGRMLSKLPVDIPLGKMLIMGSLFHQVQPVLSLAASLSVQTPFTNRAYRDPECEVRPYSQRIFFLEIIILV